jgi:hypothetical protein
MPDFTHQSSEVAARFRRQGEWSVAAREGALYRHRVHAISERAVELFLHLSARLDAVVDVFIDHPRDGHRWRGTMRFLPEVRETLGRLRWPLGSYGGVELTLVTPDDQVTITTALEVVIYSRTDRWASLLEAEGVAPCIAPPTPVWRPDLVGWSAAPELTAALAIVVDRLNLEPDE